MEPNPWSVPYCLSGNGFNFFYGFGSFESDVPNQAVDILKYFVIGTVVRHSWLQGTSGKGIQNGKVRKINPTVERKAVQAQFIHPGRRFATLASYRNW